VSANGANNFFETWFINGEIKIFAVPGVDALLIEINYGDSDVWTLECND
jgi:hypothetical protein